MWRQTHDQADEATGVYRDEKQWEGGLRQGLRSAECHARLRRLQPSTHQPKPGTLHREAKHTLVNSAKDA